VVGALEAIAPAREAEPWDNVGLLIGDPRAAVHRVMVTVDYTSDVAAEAARFGAELVVAYHPPIFSALKRITAGSVVYEALRAGVAVVTVHTALDVAPGGTNDVLASLVGLRDTVPLRRRPPPSSLGLGRVGAITGVSRGALVDRVKRALGLERVLAAGPLRGRANRVAVCAGACGDLLDDALAAGVDAYVTGELKHHDALRAAAAGMTVICTLHSNGERPGVAAMGAALARALPGVKVRVARADRDPFSIV
jgi:dinuclear metal center YbgI/SA1388 family protein